MKKLSIITICRNEEKNIERTLQSVLNQTFRDFEYIVIDGASTDGTVEKIKRYKKRLTYFISEPDRGRYHAMNKGIKQAQGIYLLFLHAGDFLYNKKVLEKVFSLNYNEDIIYGDLIYTNKGIETHISFANNNLNYQFFKNKHLPHPASFIKKELFEKHGLFDESYKIAGDHEFFCREIIQYKASTRHVPEIITVYNLSGISANPEFESLLAKERKRILKKYKPTIKSSIRNLFKKKLHP